MHDTTAFRYVPVIALALGAAGCGSGDARTDEDSGAVPRRIGHVERLDPALDAIVPPDAMFEVLAEGHEWTEGPVWVPALRAVLYSDVPRNTIYRWQEGSGATVWLTPSGYTGETARGGEMGSNGLELDAQGRLVLAQHGDRRIARLDTPVTDPEPVFMTLTDQFDGRRYHSPNDLAIHSSGAVYFTDPPYGLEGGVDDLAREMPVQGVYRVATDGSVTRLIDDLSRPNGIALSPDETVLYVANSDPAQPVIMAYDLEDDGGIANGRVLAASWGDGIAVDREGNLYVARGSDGVIVLAPDGRHLGTLVTTERTSNCAFGDDGSTLYVTSDMYLVRMRLQSRGAGFPSGSE